MTRGKLTKKQYILIIVVAVIAVGAIIGTILSLTLKKKDYYRSIMVYDLKGSATITRTGIGPIKAAVNLFLESEDEVEVAKESSLRLKLDDDKFVLAQEETRLRIIADGNRENAKTKIELMEGTITNEIRKKLNANSSYEVTTPNSVMAVRGTIFKVHTYVGTDGRRYTVVTVMEGIVSTRLVQPSGAISKEEEYIYPGEYIIIVEDDQKTVYMNNPGEETYKVLPKDVLEFFLEIVKGGSNIGAEQEEIEEWIRLSDGPSASDENGADEDTAEDSKDSGYAEITFVYEGNTFATERVKIGNCADKPMLAPSDKGDWDFDFTTIISGDMVVEWK